MYSIKCNTPFPLENGEVIENLQIGYSVYGQLNSDKSNVIWVCHSLTSDSKVLQWWSGLFGQNKLFDPNEYCIVCPNILGSCYGTTGPGTPREERRPLLDQFPRFTIRDMSNMHELLRQQLSIESIKVLIGASIGGQQALEWSISRPETFERMILLATNAKHSSYGIAFNESQRMAIFADATYGQGKVDDAKTGLASARSIAMLSYRSYAGYNSGHREEDENKSEEFKAESYQRYQGEKLAQRFNVYSYVALTRAMDSHNVGRNRKGVARALGQIRAETLVIGVSSDNLFPVEEQEFLANAIPNSQIGIIDSKFGHDGFLIETEQISLLMKDFIFNNYNKHKRTSFNRVALRKELNSTNN